MDKISVLNKRVQSNMENKQRDVFLESNSHIDHLKLRYKFDTYDELCIRVSSVVSSVEQINDRENWQRRFYQLLQRRWFIPAGNTLVAGIRPIRPNCCILGIVTDQNEKEMIVRATRLWKDAIGIGFDLTGHSDPVKILKRLSLINHSIDLKYRPRRGNMATLSIDHPRCLEFIQAKSINPDNLYNFNISITVQSDKLDLYKDKLQKIAEAAWISGDPGIIFIDRLQDAYIDQLGPISTVVPCGEQGMHTDETCNLGSINLAIPEILDNLEQIIPDAVRFLDNVVDLLDIPDEKMRNMSSRVRRIGLGVMGFADLLQHRNIVYGSEECLKLSNDLARRISNIATQASIDLALERGAMKLDKFTVCKIGYKFRNITRTCIAPTGGIGELMGVKGFAIEPRFIECTLISPEAHLQVQAKWQKYIDNCISKTVNLPSSITVEEILQIFLKANELGCKSVTVYRDGSRKSQPRCTADNDTCN